MAQAIYTQSSTAAPEYIVVVSNEDDYHAGFHHFAEQVNRKLRAGYQLHGAPLSINKTLCQAMVRTTGDQAGSETSAYYQHPTRAGTF